MRPRRTRIVLICLTLFLGGYLTGFWLGYTVCPIPELFERETFPAL